MIYGVETQAAQATTGPPSFFTQAVIIDNAAVASGIYKNAQSTADNALLTISLWARCADVSSSPTFVTLAAGEMYMQAKFSFATDIVFIARNSAATKTVQLGSANGVFSTATTGNHIFASFDTNHAAGAKLLNLYVNGANVKNGGNTFDTDIAFTIGFSGKNMGVPADQAFLASTQIATIHFAEVWMAIGQYVDPANLTKFRSATGHPVDLGSNGQSPTGTAPTYYFKGPAASFHTNLGTGATMTSEGSITSSSSGSLMPYVLTYRLVKGSPLTEAEFDGNIHNLDGRTVAIEAQMPVVSVTDAQINTAGHLEIFLSNSTVIDAGPMPIAGSFAASFKGPWTPLTIYHVNDLFTAPGSNWLGAVLRDHTSASTFDWGANDGMGHEFYAVVVPFAPSATSVTLTSTTYTIGLADVNTYIRTTGDSTAHFIDITIPTDAAAPIPIDSDIHFRQSSDDQIVFMGVGGVTLNFADDVNPITAVRGAVVTLKKIGTNEWDLFGRLQQVTA